jgi:hypothetical protein
MKLADGRRDQRAAGAGPQPNATSPFSLSSVSQQAAQLNV